MALYIINIAQIVSPMQYIRRATDALGRADDAVQRVIREKVLRVPADGGRASSGPMRGVRDVMAQTVHAGRAGGNAPKNHKFQGNSDRENMGALIATRALQAGGVTLAGAGLMELTAQLQGQQTNSQIPM